MFQPRVKLEFVRRYCLPEQGWKLFVDIDPSEAGRTGGKRKTQEARRRQKQMQEDAERARSELEKLGAQVGGRRATWYEKCGLPPMNGDRDIVAVNTRKRTYVIAEVEGESSGQPEKKLYKAMGQLVMAASQEIPENWNRKLVLVVHGEEISKHLACATALEKMGISAISLDTKKEHDRWLSGEPLPLGSLQHDRTLRRIRGGRRCPGLAGIAGVACSAWSGHGAGG